MPVALILNLIVLALEARGLALSIPGRRWKIFAFYTQLSNLTAVISSLLLVMFGMVPTVIVLRYLSSCMLVMTVLVTVCVLIPLGGDPKLLLFSGSGLYVHLLCPTVSVGSYLFAEKHPQSAAAILLPTMLTLSYGLTMLWLNARGRFDGPYPFFRVKNQTVRATIRWMGILTATIALVSSTVWFLGTVMAS